MPEAGVGAEVRRRGRAGGVSCFAEGGDVRGLALVRMRHSSVPQAAGESGTPHRCRARSRSCRQGTSAPSWCRRSGRYTDCDTPRHRSRTQGSQSWGSWRRRAPRRAGAGRALASAWRALVLLRRGGGSCQRCTGARCEPLLWWPGLSNTTGTAQRAILSARTSGRRVAGAARLLPRALVLLLGPSAAGHAGVVVDFAIQPTDQHRDTGALTGQLGCGRRRGRRRRRRGGAGDDCCKKQRRQRPKGK